MAYDAHKNLAISTVATAPSPATSGTSLVVASGHGTRFPAADGGGNNEFNATVWPTGETPTPANAEVVRVTQVSTDTFTITRAQESTSARTIVVGDNIAATITAKSLTDIETGSLQVANDLSDVNSAATARTNLGLGTAATSASTAFDVPPDFVVDSIEGASNPWNLDGVVANGTVVLLTSVTTVTLPAASGLTAGARFEIANGTGSPLSLTANCAGADEFASAATSINPTLPAGAAIYVNKMDTGIGFEWGWDWAGSVVSPSSSTDGNIVTFDGTDGGKIQDSGTAVADVVTGPASAVGDRIATFNGTTGKIIQDSGSALSDLGDVVGPASATANNLVTFDGTTGKLVQDSGSAVSDFVALTQVVDWGGAAPSGGSALYLAGPGFLADTYNTASISANIMWYEPFIITESTSFDRVAIEITSAAGSGTAYTAVYEADSAWQPGAQVYLSSTYDLTSATFQEKTASFTLTPGRYLKAYTASQAATLRFAGAATPFFISGSNTPMGAWYVSRTYSAPADPGTFWDSVQIYTGGFRMKVFLRPL